MQRLDGSGAWRELAILVAATDHQKDLAYWYLGRAAEGLGLPTAASRYYRQAYSLTTGRLAAPKCRTIPGDCAGVDLRARLSERLRHLAARTSIVGTRVPRSRDEGATPAASSTEAPTLAAVRLHLQARHPDCTVLTLRENFRGALPGIAQPVLVARYHYTECGAGSVNQSTFGIFILESGRIRDLRPEPMEEEGVTQVSVADDRITVVTRTPGPNEERCCPTMLGLKVFAARAGRVVQMP